MPAAVAGETRYGLALTNLDEPLFDDAGATKRDLIDYLDAICDRIIPVLRDRPLSVRTSWPHIYVPVDRA